MFAVEIKKPLWIAFLHRYVNPGEKLLIENNNVLREDGKNPGGGAQLSQFGEIAPFSVYTLAPRLDYALLKEGDKVLVHRAGGIGDILWMLPFVFEMQDRGAEIYLSCAERFRSVQPLFGPTKSVDLVMHPVSELPKFDWMFTTEGAVEMYKEPVQYLEGYSDRAANVPEEIKNIDNYRDKDSKYIKRAVDNWHNSPEYTSLVHTDEFDILFAPNASSPIRSAPALVGQIKRLESNHTVRVLAGTNQPISFAESAVYGALPGEQFVDMVERAKLICGVDSGVAHLAFWLGKPLIAVYGPIDSAGRLPKDIERVTVVNASDLCPLGKPCWWHNIFCPLGMSYGKQVPFCAALGALSPKAIVELVELKLRGRAKTSYTGKELLVDKTPAQEQFEGLHAPNGQVVKAVF